MKTSTSKTVQNLALSSLFAALICLSTTYLLHFNMGPLGYTHLGDAFIYLAAAFLPMPYAMAASAIGAGLADLLSGAPEWIIFTVIIKALMAMCFTSKKETVINTRNVIGGLVAGIVNIVGYYLATVALYGNWLVAILSWGGVFQSGGGLALFVLVGVLLDRAHMKTRLQNMGRFG